MSMENAQEFKNVWRLESISGDNKYDADELYRRLFDRISDLDAMRILAKLYKKEELTKIPDGANLDWDKKTWTDFVEELDEKIKSEGGVDKAGDSMEYDLTDEELKTMHDLNSIVEKIKSTRKITEEQRDKIKSVYELVDWIDNHWDGMFVSSSLAEQIEQWAEIAEIWCEEDFDELYDFWERAED